MTEESTTLFDEAQITVYNLREFGIENFKKDWAAWGRRARPEYLCAGRVALVILPGGARDLVQGDFK